MSNKSQVSFCFTGFHNKAIHKEKLLRELNDCTVKINTIGTGIYKIFVHSSEPAFNTLRVCRRICYTAMYDENEIIDSN